MPPRRPNTHDNRERAGRVDAIAEGQAPRRLGTALTPVRLGRRPRARGAVSPETRDLGTSGREPSAAAAARRQRRRRRERAAGGVSRCCRAAGIARVPWTLSAAGPSRRVSPAAERSAPQRSPAVPRDGGPLIGSTGAGDGCHVICSTEVSWEIGSLLGNWRRC